MPLPFILAGIAVVSGICGVVKGAESVSKNSQTKELYEEAEYIYDQAINTLEATKEKTTAALVNLGKLKLETWDNQFGRFISLIEKVKNVQLTGEAVTDTKLQNNVNNYDLWVMKDMSVKAKEVVAGGLQSLGAGTLAGVASYGGAMLFASASTGTAISTLTGVAATNATLAWFGGGSLAAGGLGIAGGTMVLGGIVTGPILAVGGMLMAAKARINLAEAKAIYSKAEVAVEEIKNATVVLESVYKVSNQFEFIIQNMSNRTTQILNVLEESLKEAEKNKSKFIIFKVKKMLFKVFRKELKMEYLDLNAEQRKSIHIAYQFAQSLKVVLETPILTQDGALDNACTDVLTSSQYLLETQNSKD